MGRCRLRAVWLAAGLAAFTASDARAQKPLQFGASAELVLIDLVATDRDGRTVTDLRADRYLATAPGRKQVVFYSAGYAMQPAATVSEIVDVEITSEVKPPKKGRYQLTVVARHSGGRLASASTTFEIP